LPIYKINERLLPTTICADTRLYIESMQWHLLVYSSSLEVCKRYRISMHKVFSGIAARNKTTKGWFSGLKLHLIINRNGGIVKAFFSSGNKYDRA